MKYTLLNMFFEFRILLSSFYIAKFLLYIGFVESVMKELFIRSFSDATCLPISLESFSFNYSKGEVTIKNLKISSPPFRLDPRWRNLHIVTYDAVTIKFPFWTSLLVFVSSKFRTLYFFSMNIVGLKYFVEGYQDDPTHPVCYNIQLIGSDHSNFDLNNSSFIRISRSFQEQVMKAKKNIKNILKKVFSIFFYLNAIDLF